MKTRIKKQIRLKKGSQGEGYDGKQRKKKRWRS